ncbi:MAG: TIGR00269 family protein [Candidatus Micrarchaeia archaeon]|jgi:uncharacterized protein (TIGR00269 family)
MTSEIACNCCSKRPAVIGLSYSGLDLCSPCFFKLFERRVRKANRDFAMLRRGDRILVGISGGKDSAAMLHVLDKMAKRIGNITLIPVLIDEGIKGYREKAKKKAESLCKAHGYKLIVFSFASLSGHSLDQIIKIRGKSRNPEFKSMGACAICGTLRKYLLNKAALKLKANKVAIGHNADDIGQTFLMNMLRADPEGVSRFGPVSENGADGLTVPRIKPLIYIPERECAYYCALKGLSYHLGECPYAMEAFRGLAKDFLNDAEAKYPGIKFNVLKSYLSMRDVLEENRGKSRKSIPSCKCEKCGGKSSKEVCRACQVLSYLYE